MELRRTRRGWPAGEEPPSSTCPPAAAPLLWPGPLRGSSVPPSQSPGLASSRGCFQTRREQLLLGLSPGASMLFSRGRTPQCLHLLGQDWKIAGACAEPAWVSVIRPRTKHELKF